MSTVDSPAAAWARTSATMLAELPPGYRRSDRMATSYKVTVSRTTGTKRAIRTIHLAAWLVKDCESRNEETP
ncbi:hypothetical protein Adu01nite_02880 [Paractinoplanes durhamensis]|uniref:Uncharacterized protein n=1 Tax=Paractinoplanes durhamensis TaxID=113563 RepID=A0ABQ3YMY4_9ACTN|nr:hypothetical protein Adu01nite_02880 [Actinoplanes durhamensis]